jgi:sugar phosphate isomerase/epimerase
MYTRRELGKLALTALPAAHLLRSAGFAQAKPNSKVRGVMIGMNVPYNFGGRNAPVDEIIDKCVQLGVSGLELRTQPVEAFLGLPDALVTAAAPPGGRNAKPSTPEQDAARKTAADEIRKWRLAAPMDKVPALRRKFEEAGILVEIVKVDNIFDMADDVVDYEFQLAKALGARAISTEIAHVDPKAPEVAMSRHKRLGQFADKHQLMVGYHGHAKTTPEMYASAAADAKYNGMNIDIGHWVAGNFGSPVEFMKKHHAKITHIHVKDRKKDEAGGGGQNVPFGQGDTPVVEVLRLIRDNKWPIQATIEFEYLPGSASAADRMAELPKAIQFCKDALLG